MKKERIEFYDEHDDDTSGSSEGSEGSSESEDYESSRFGMRSCRRKKVSYKFDEYEDMINEAIGPDLETAKGAGRLI